MTGMLIPLVVEPDRDDPDCATLCVDGQVAVRSARFVLDTGATPTQIVTADAPPGPTRSGVTTGVFGAADTVRTVAPEIQVGDLAIANLDVDIVASSHPQARNLLGLDVLAGRPAAGSGPARRRDRRAAACCPTVAGSPAGQDRPSDDRHPVAGGDGTWRVGRRSRHDHRVRGVRARASGAVHRGPRRWRSRGNGLSDKSHAFATRECLSERKIDGSVPGTRSPETDNPRAAPPTGALRASSKSRLDKCRQPGDRVTVRFSPGHRTSRMGPAGCAAS